MKHAVEASGSYEIYSASDSFDRIQASSPRFQLNNESCGDHNHVPSSWLLTTGTVDVSGNCWINGY